VLPSGCTRVAPVSLQQRQAVLLAAPASRGGGSPPTLPSRSPVREPHPTGSTTVSRHPAGSRHPRGGPALTPQGTRRDAWCLASRVYGPEPAAANGRQGGGKGNPSSRRRQRLFPSTPEGVDPIPNRGKPRHRLTNSSCRYIASSLHKNRNTTDHAPSVPHEC